MIILFAIILIVLLRNESAKLPQESLKPDKLNIDTISANKRAIVLAIINITLFVLLIVIMLSIESKIRSTCNLNFRWSSILALVIYDVVGGIFWMAGTVFSMRNFKLKNKWSLTILLINQIYVFIYLVLIIWSIVSLSTDRLIK